MEIFDFSSITTSIGKLIEAYEKSEENEVKHSNFANTFGHMEIGMHWENASGNQIKGKLIKIHGNKKSGPAFIL